VTAGTRQRLCKVGPLLGLVPFLLLSSGCGGDDYSESLVYPVRSDPVIMDVPSKEQTEPDRPGQLPLFALKDIDDPRNPWFKNDDLKVKDPAKLKAEDRQELQDALQDVFGTPAHPTVELITSETRQMLQLDEDTLKDGSKLYRQYCLQCHGLTGDGRGPTAKWVNPHPRDYRMGLFKFQSVDQATVGKDLPPRREDLYRTIHEGVEGTAMQSYNMLPPAEIDALVSYVIHLSIRGEVEDKFFREANNDEKEKTYRIKGGSITGFIKGKRNSGGAVRDVADKWREAAEPERKIKPAAYKINDANKAELDASIRRGQEIFLSKGSVKGECYTCHIDYGRKALYKADKWATMVRPRDLTRGNYRGGRRPVDFYYRVHSGINGSGMLKQGKELNGDQIWDVVNFVRALPYPEMRKSLERSID
jgi:mono/diheme cytochrome c family protein